jgi:hypothetical protein
MDLKKRFRFISVQLLLLGTLTIQGLAPDVDNLATLRGLYVLCSVPVPLQYFEHHTGEDEASVCTPNCNATSVEESLETLGRSLRLEFVSASVHKRLGIKRNFLLEMIERSVLSGNQLCVAYCRLTC